MSRVFFGFFFISTVRNQIEISEDKYIFFHIRCLSLGSSLVNFTLVFVSFFPSPVLINRCILPFIIRFNT